MKSKKPSAKSEKKAGPVAEKRAKPTEKEPRKRDGEAVPSSVDAKESQPQATQETKPAEAPKSREWVTQTFTTPDKDIHILMPKDIAKHHGDPTKPEENSYAAIRQRFTADLEWLVRRAAAGEWDAILILAEFGVDAAAFLGSLTEFFPDKIKRVARTLAEWPLVISPRDNYPQNAKKLRNQIELGEGIPVRDDKVLYKTKPLLQRAVVFHALHVFLSLRDWNKSARRAEQTKKGRSDLSLAGASDECKGDEQAAHVRAVLLAATDAEIRRAEKSIEDARQGVIFHQRKLIALLRVPMLPPNIPARSQLAEDALKLPELSLATKEQWFELMLKSLGILLGNELEENEVLRKIGDSRGDVEIRKLCKDGSPEEFKRRKIELRHNATVNDAIGRRITLRLNEALTAFVKERT